MKKKPTFIWMVSVFCFMTAAFVLAACQPTPNEPVVIEKNEENMIQQAQQTKQPITTDDSAKDSERSLIQQQFAQYSPYQTTFNGNSNAFSVTADANLTLPDQNTMPIVEVAAEEFSEEMIQKIFDYTCSDTSMYPKDEMKTKGFLASEVARLQQMISDGVDSDGNLLKQLQQLQSEYETAPDEKVTPVRTVTFQEKETDYFTYREFDARSSLVSNNGRVFSVKSSFASKGADESSRTNAQLIYVNFDAIGSVAFPEIENVTGSSTIPDGSNLGFTPLEAAAAADTFCQDAGISDMVIDKVLLVKSGIPSSYLKNENATDLSEYGYKITFERTQDGVTVFSPDTTSYTGELDNSAEWLYEQFDIVMNNNGIVYISWKTPLKATKTVVSDCSLLPFTEIESIFERMMKIQYEPMISLYQYDSAKYQVTEIRLSLLRIAKKDSISSGLLVPTWDFFGTGAYTRAGETLPMNEGNTGLLLSINAVDGSFINPQQGY